MCRVTGGWPLNSADVCASGVLCLWEVQHHCSYMYMRGLVQLCGSGLHARPSQPKRLDTLRTNHPKPPSPAPSRPSARRTSRRLAPRWFKAGWRWFERAACAHAAREDSAQATRRPKPPARAVSWRQHAAVASRAVALTRAVPSLVRWPSTRNPVRVGTAWAWGRAKDARRTSARRCWCIRITCQTRGARRQRIHRTGWAWAFLMHAVEVSGTVTARVPSKRTPAATQPRGARCAQPTSELSTTVKRYAAERPSRKRAQPPMARAVRPQRRRASASRGVSHTPPLRVGAQD